MTISPAKLLLTRKKQEKDVSFVKNLQYARWNHKTFRREITSHAANLQAIRAYFGDQLLETKAENFGKTSPQA